MHCIFISVEFLDHEEEWGHCIIFFQKHAAKKLAAASSPSPAPAANVVEEENQEQEGLIDEIVNPTGPMPSSVLLEEI